MGSGAAFELEDRFTATEADAIATPAAGFPGGEMLTRINPDDSATAATWRPPDAVTALAGHRLMAMVKPFISHRVYGRVSNELTG